MNPLIEKQDDEQLTDQTGDAMVRTYLQKKYGVAPKDAQAAMSTGNSNAGAEALEATPHKYDRIAQDDSSIKQAKEQAASQRLSSGLFDAMHTAFGGREGAFDKHYAAADKVVADARADKQEKLGGILTSDKLKRQEAGDKRAAIEQGRVDTEYNRTRDVKSTTSKWAQAAVKANLKNKVGEAQQAGDQAAAAELQAIADGIDQYSAHDLANLAALKDVSYKDMLNNQAAMARVRAQEAGANSRLARQEKAEDRRTSELKSKREKDLRGYLGDPIMKEAVQGRAAFDKFNATVDLGNPAGAEAALVLWQKGLDPTSVVRESEFARTPEMGGLVRRVEAAYQKMAGGGPVTPEMAKELKAAMTAMQGAYQQYARSKLNVIDSNVQEYGLNANNIYGEIYDDIAGRTQGQASKTQLQLDAEEVLNDPAAPEEAKADARRALGLGN